MQVLIIIVVVAVLAVIAYRYLQIKQLPETLSQVDPEDPELQQAIANAQKTLPLFWQKYASAVNQPDYYVKVRLEGPTTAESIWLSELENEGDQISGIVNQRPAYLEVQEGQRIRCDADNISDWMYSESGKIHGNYTGRVLAKPQNMSKGQYESMRDSFAPLPESDETL